MSLGGFDNRMQTREEKITETEDRIIESTQFKKKRKETKKLKLPEMIQ